MVLLHLTVKDLIVSFEPRRSFWLIWCGQVLLDFHHILRERIGQGFEDLKRDPKRYQGFQPPELEVEVPRDESQLPWTVGYIFMAATSSTRMRQLLKPKKNDIVTSGRLVKAASVLKGMMESGAGEIEVRILEQEYGFAFEVPEVLQLDRDRETARA